jgi:predicted nucleic acid-binding protein
VFTALLDTSVLWPSLQRNFLLSLAIEGMYRPVWSAAILEELEYHETAKLIKRGEATDEAARRALRLVTQMRAAFDDAEVQGWEGLEGTYGLPDPDDEHVVAAAVVAGAGAIITHNLRHFPIAKLPVGIRALAPAEFTASTVSLDPIRARAAVSAIVARSGRKGPRLTQDEVLDTLADRYSMTAAAEIIRQAR